VCKVHKLGSARRADRLAATTSPGYAAVDAMVALIILSLTVILSLGAFQAASRATRRAVEIETARVLLGRVIESEPKDFAGSSGTAPGFAWTLQTQPTASNALIDVCRRAAEVVATSSGRRYGAVTLVACPPRSQT
jgi:hypothetical protein